MREILNKRANILTENIVFIFINVAFLAIILLFLFSRMSGSAGIEERYAKQLAMIIDASKPGMEIYNEMTKAIDKAEDNDFPLKKIVTISGNIVTVRLKEGAGSSYSFFNDVDVNVNFVSKEGGYYFVIKEK
jgi:hypothetical protein